MESILQMHLLQVSYINDDLIIVSVGLLNVWVGLITVVVGVMRYEIVEIRNDWDGSRKKECEIM